MIPAITREEIEMSDVKELYRRALERFGEHVEKIRDDQWQGPTPCTDWDVRVLVRHLVSENLWMPPLLAGLTVADVSNRLDGDLLGEDPKSAWLDSAKKSGDAVAAVPLDRTVHLSRREVPAEDYISEVMTDLAIHGWDLARAIGDDEAIDPEIVNRLYKEFKDREGELKVIGMFGPKVFPPKGADRQTRLLAIFGRVARRLP